MARDLTGMVGELASLKADATQWLEGPEYEALRLRLEMAHATAASAVAAGKKGEDTCFGDSGGPLFDRVSGRYRQIGITSFGYGCATTRFPGVYTEVNAPRVQDFIERATARN
jgi:secreted trypsin-like serine protease